LDAAPVLCRACIGSSSGEIRIIVVTLCEIVLDRSVESNYSTVMSYY